MGNAHRRLKYTRKMFNEAQHVKTQKGKVLPTIAVPTMMQVASEVQKALEDPPSEAQSKRSRKRVLQQQAVQETVDPLVYISQLNRVFTEFPMIFEQAQEDMNRLELEYNDLTHAIELVSIKNSREAVHIVNRLQENRQKRRDAKDFTLIAKVLYDFTKGRPEVSSQINRIMNEMIRTQDALSRRSYTPRVLGSLTEAYEELGLKTSEGGEG